MYNVLIRDVRRRTTHLFRRDRPTPHGARRTARPARRALRPRGHRRRGFARARPRFTAERDVDIVALVGSDGLMPAEPLPGTLAEACARVARDFDLPTDWLNSEPAGMLRLGLPQGFAERLDRRVPAARGTDRDPAGDRRHPPGGGRVPRQGPRRPRSVRPPIRRPDRGVPAQPAVTASSWPDRHRPRRLATGGCETRPAGRILGPPRRRIDLEHHRRI